MLLAVQGLLKVVPQSQSAESVALRQASGFQAGLHVKGICPTCKTHFKYHVHGTDPFGPAPHYTFHQVAECQHTGLCISCNAIVHNARTMGGRDMAYEFECRGCRKLFTYHLAYQQVWAGLQHACDACARADVVAAREALRTLQRVRAECQAENARKRAACGEDDDVDWDLLDAQVVAHMEQRARVAPPAPAVQMPVVAPGPVASAPDHEAVPSSRSAPTASGVAAEPSATSQVADGKAQDGGDDAAS